MDMNARHALAPLVMLMGLALSFPARAIHMEEPGSTACVGNSAQDDNALRKRTDGATNESTSSVIVTCSMPVIGLMIPPNDSTRVNRVRVQFFNNAAGSRSVGCRLVLTNAPTGGPTLLGNVTVPRNAYAFMVLQPEGDRFGHRTFALTCTLPPLMTIQKVIVDTSEFQFIPME
jgi:hypothetical protein